MAYYHQQASEVDDFLGSRGFPQPAYTGYDGAGHVDQGPFHDDNRRSRHYSQYSSRQQSHSPPKHRTTSQERRRERRAQRYAEDPERELARQAERRERRAKRGMSAQSMGTTDADGHSTYKGHSDDSLDNSSTDDLAATAPLANRSLYPHAAWHDRDTDSAFELDNYKHGSGDQGNHAKYIYDRARKRKRWMIIGAVAAIVVLLIIIIVPSVLLTRPKWNYALRYDQVNNTEAFTSGGASHNPVSDVTDGIGAGNDSYTYYSGNATNFPNNTQWVSFGDMWSNNLNNIKQSCGWLKYGADDTDQQTKDIYNAIQNRANASLVDHRFILALVLQESHGCVHTPYTTSSGGVKNTGLMQAHDGAEFSSHFQQQSILAMVQDGTQGTNSTEGDGLVQYLNTYGNPYKAARGYNSGYIPTSGNLSEAAGATACYVSDVANRLTGWVNAKSKCPGSSE